MPSRSDLESAAHRAAKKISDAASWLDVERSTVSALGKPTFAIGVISGLVKGAVVSVADLVLLSKTLALADYHATHHARTPLERATGMLGLLNPVNLFTGTSALTVATFWPGFDRMAEEAYHEREALINGLISIFKNPGATFGHVVDAQKAKYAQWEAYNNSHSLSSEFHAGVLFGELLLDVLLIVDGVTAIAKLASKAPTLIKALTELTPELQIAARNSVRAAEELAAEQARTARLARDAAGQSGKRAGEVESAASTASKKAEVSTKTAESCGSKCSVAGEPVSMVSGEEMLEREDFTWQGPLAMVWRRFYRSGSSGMSRVLGHGWLSPLDEHLDIGGRVTYTNCDGQQIDLPLPAPGGVAINIPEKLRLYREEDAFRLVSESGPERVFAGRDGRCALSRLQERAGFRIDLLRNADGTVHAMVANWGRALVLAYAAGRIVSIGPAASINDRYEPAGEPFVRYAYSTDGDLVSAVDRLGNGEKYRYRNHLLVGRTLASGFNFHFEWDGDGPRARCTRSWGDGGIYDYRFEWLPDGISRAIDSRGGVTTFEHNAAGQLLCKRSPEGRETRFAYNARNLLATQTDGAGTATQYRYDSQGRLTSVIDGLGHQHRIERDADGQISAITDPLGHRWTQVHDAKGRLIESSDPRGAITRHIYNAQGLPAVSIDASGRQRRLLWDEHMRLVGDIGFDGIRRRYQYDAADRIVAAVTQDRLRTRYEYDAVGRTTAVHAPDGRITRMRYDAAGRLTHFIDGAGQTTEYRYADALWEVTSRVDPMGHVIRYEYDLERNLVGLFNAKGERYRLTYDLDENLIEECGFDGRRQRYEFDAAGFLTQHLARVTGVGGETTWRATLFQRDGLGRLLGKRLPGGSAANYTYDACGRMVSAANADSTVSFSYDGTGRLLREVQNGQAVTQQFDALGRLSGVRTPDGLQVDYHRDTTGRLAGIDLDGIALTRHRWDDLGNEVARTQGGLESRFEHDPVGRLLRHRAGRSDQESVLGRRYEYDRAGRLAAVDDLRSGGTRYLYDPADRLIEAHGLSVERFVHDPAGNLLGQTPSGGWVRGDRLVMMGDRHFSYDDAGNLVEERRGKGSHALTRYGYDDDNRLISAQTLSGSVEFRYDALGRRISKRSGLGETQFVYSGVHLLCERTSNRNRTYLFEPQSFRPLTLIEGIEEAGSTEHRRVYHYHLDHLGTPRELTDVNGSIVWSTQYRCYGALALTRPEEIENPLRLQGQYLDVETGLHYNLNRYYDPACGRFINQDPVGLAGGDNLYQYAPNPINWVDPTGLTAVCTDLTGHRASHILDRHRSGAGISGKTEFPAGWRDEDILHHVSDVATDPHSTPGVGKWNSPYAIGTRDGVTIRVDFYPPDHPTYAGKISTAYPINVAPNP